MPTGMIHFQDTWLLMISTFCLMLAVGDDSATQQYNSIATLACNSGFSNHCNRPEQLDLVCYAWLLCTPAQLQSQCLHLC
jgi:hypothetical protein